MSGRGIRLSLQEEQRVGPVLAERYRSGASLRQVAAEVGLSYGLVRRLVLDQGVPMRRRQARARSAPQQRRLTREEKRLLGPQLGAGYRAGATVRLLAEINGLSYSVVHGLLHDERIDMRPRGGAGNRQRRAVLRAHGALPDPPHATGGRNDLTVQDELRIGAGLADRYQRGATLLDLATGSGMSYRVVRRLLSEQGVRFRSPGGGNAHHTDLTAHGDTCAADGPKGARK